MGNRLSGKVAIISGASRGMGEATVRAFCAEGAKVLAIDMLESDGNKLVNDLKDEGYQVEFLCVNVAKECDWEIAIKVCSEKLGEPNVLVNNAGIIGPSNVFHELSPENFTKVIDVNVKGVYLGMRAVLPFMLKSKTGSIINISSIWGHVAAAGFSAYHASKGAVTLMTKNAAVSYAKNGIRVNSIHPGLVQTPLIDVLDSDDQSGIIGLTPMGRAGRPEEIANTAVFLASDESSYMTGSSVFVDGGYTAM